MSSLAPAEGPEERALLDRIGRAIRKKLDNVGFANEAKAVAKKRQRPNAASIYVCGEARCIYACMHGLTAQGMHVFGKCLFLMDQGALARTVAPVLQGREGYKVGFWIHSSYSFTSTLTPEGTPASFTETS